MITLNWIFTNGHKWHKAFESVQMAENYVYLCGMITNFSIDRVWIETESGEEWIKEKC